MKLTALLFLGLLSFNATANELVSDMAMVLSDPAVSRVVDKTLARAAVTVGQISFEGILRSDAPTKCPGSRAYQLLYRLMPKHDPKPQRCTQSVVLGDCEAAEAGISVSHSVDCLIIK